MTDINILEENQESEPIKETKEAENIVKHVKEHSKRINFQCTYCKLKFDNDYELKTHKLIHLKCKTCNKSFKKASYLAKHEKIHTGDKPFKCDTCEKRYSRSCRLKIHQVVHTIENESIHGEKPYQCDTC